MMDLPQDIPLAYYLSCLVGGYLLGSLPFGVILTRLAGQGDIRKIGSGNIGATNVLRTGNKSLALSTLILDGAKGALAILLAFVLFGDTPLVYFAGGGAFFGHLYSIFLGFRGGKGVATFLGTLLAINWPLGLVCCMTWAITAALFRISSLAALTAAVAAPLYSGLMLENTTLAYFSIILCIMIFIRHRENIKRLLGGTEPRIGKRSE